MHSPNHMSMRLSRQSHVARAASATKKNWRESSKPIKPGSNYPAKEFCSNCGLCDTYYVAHVADACAFLGEGVVLWLYALFGGDSSVAHACSRAAALCRLCRRYHGTFHSHWPVKCVSPVPGSAQFLQWRCEPVKTAGSALYCESKLYAQAYPNKRPPLPRHCTIYERLTQHTERRFECMSARAGMAKIPKLEHQVHGRERDLSDEDELRFGVYDEMLYARNTPGIEGAQWTGIVTQVAINMLESGKVDAVVCVQSDENDRSASVLRLERIVLELPRAASGLEGLRMGCSHHSSSIAHRTRAAEDCAG